ncbi:GNAT family N-acetyltransferase [Sediminitomix flava]|nr:GNAT family protein [Sediminitomix flava]
MKMKTNRPVEIRLRRLNERDMKPLQEIADNKKIFDNLPDFFPFPYTLDDAKRFLTLTESEEKTCTFAIEWEGVLVGIISLIPQADIYAKSMKVGYWLGEAYWGKGIATAALRKICAYAWQNFDINRLFSSVIAYNKSSVKVMEKAGFTFEGIGRKAIFKNGQFYDDHYYGLLKDD